MFRQQTVPRGTAPPVMIDFRLWADRKRLNFALAGIFEVRELPDLTLSGFSKWDERGRTYWAHVLFNRKHQLLSVQVHPEVEMEELMDRGVAVWAESDDGQESPGKILIRESVDLLAATSKQSLTG
jgi:hypothetical protein